MLCAGIIKAIAAINWIEAVRTLAPVATAVIAFLALRNWKRQDKAKREAEFLDALIEETHTYVVEMSPPVALVRTVEIGMQSHVSTWEDGDQTIKGAIAYIQKNGETESKRLRVALAAVQPSVIRLRSLAAKGQIFKFKGYTKCYDAIIMLTWNFSRIEALLSIIESPTSNWEHPSMLKLLKDVMAIKPDDIRKSLTENNAAILEFSRKTYQRLYD
jgi:hypothetical protein